MSPDAEHVSMEKTALSGLYNIWLSSMALIHSEQKSGTYNLLFLNLSLTKLKRIYHRSTLEAILLQCCPSPTQYPSWMKNDNGRLKIILLGFFITNERFFRKIWMYTVIHLYKHFSLTQKLKVNTNKLMMEFKKVKNLHEENYTITYCLMS